MCKQKHNNITELLSAWIPFRSICTMPGSITIVIVKVLNKEEIVVCEISYKSLAAIELQQIVSVLLGVFLLIYLNKTYESFKFSPLASLIICYLFNNFK